MTPPLDPKLPHDIFLRPAARSRMAARVARRTREHAIDGLLRPGTIIDKYRIEELLGTGGFAAVYRATHMLLDMTVAIKHLRPDVLARQPEIAAQLLAEARSVARVQHPRVVRVFDLEQSPALTYVVMEFIDGEPLSRAIQRRGRIPADEVIHVGIDTADGLAAAHEQGLVHRDVKPANILLTKTGRACVVDFGLARAGVAARSEPRAAGGVVGTRGYAAPEQLRNPANVDLRADIYALGVTLREALHGRGHTCSEPAAMSRIEQILAWMTSSEPADRPRSYANLIAELRACAAGRSI